MAKISISKILNRRRVVPAAALPKVDQQRLSPGELRSGYTGIFPVDDERLQLFEVDLEPAAEIRPHAHTAPEIIYVVDGELDLGRQTLRSGDAMYIEEYVLYGFRAGPDGCRFLNFRPASQVKYLSKSELVHARQKAAGERSELERG